MNTSFFQLSIFKKYLAKCKYLFTKSYLTKIMARACSGSHELLFIIYKRLCVKCRFFAVKLQYRNNIGVNAVTIRTSIFRVNSLTLQNKTNKIRRNTEKWKESIIIYLYKVRFFFIIQVGLNSVTFYCLQELVKFRLQTTNRRHLLWYECSVISTIPHLVMCPAHRVLSLLSIAKSRFIQVFQTNVPEHSQDKIQIFQDTHIAQIQGKVIIFFITHLNQNPTTHQKRRK